MEGMLEALKAMSNLETMTLDELIALNTKLSELRLQTGGEVRKAVYAYALEVNLWITRRVLDREEDIRAAHGRDPARAELHQHVAPLGLSSDGKLDNMLRRLHLVKP
ncbi:hypothetical protein Rctr197k_084 [Virus Rctr197k]|nr:hypothetical protein Rctr197k_084 [Virus Rctr197k]